jgi:hypothetical protein
MTELCGQITIENNGMCLKFDSEAIATGRCTSIITLLRSKGITPTLLLESLDADSDSTEYGLDPPVSPAVTDILDEYCEGTWHDDDIGALYPPIIKTLGEKVITEG